MAICTNLPHRNAASILPQITKCWCMCIFVQVYMCVWCMFVYCRCVSGACVIVCACMCGVHFLGHCVCVPVCGGFCVCVCVFCLSVMYECLQITCLLILQFWDLQSFAHYLTPDAVVTLDFLCMLLPPLTHIPPFLATHWPFWKCLTINIHYVLLFVLVQNQVCMWHSASVT